jgi:hypothetical protein
LPEEEHEANSINNATMYFADFNVIKVATFCGNAYKEQALVFFWQQFYKFMTTPK